MRELIKKIQPLSALKNYGGILCHGCFDILHVGHVRHLKYARALSPTLPLIVTITGDTHIRKGPGRPVFDEWLRAEVLAAMEMVDVVSVVDEPTGLTAITTIRPQYYVKGKEYAEPIGINGMEQRAVQERGGCIIFTDRWASSTEIVERLLNVSLQRDRAT